MWEYYAHTKLFCIFLAIFESSNRYLPSSSDSVCVSKPKHIALLTCRRVGGLTILHFLRQNKLFDSFNMKLLHVSQLVRITCAAARRKNCGGGGFSKFRLAWRRAEFFKTSYRSTIRYQSSKLLSFFLRNSRFFAFWRQTDRRTDGQHRYA